MARKCETIKRKVTQSGIEVTLFDKTVIKTYSKKSVSFMMFKTHAEAKKEFSKFRHGNKRL